MAGAQRVYKQRIRSTQTLKKMFRAMELIAASRITRAREHARAAAPYSRALTRAVSAVATHTQIDHPLTTDRADTNRVAMLVVTADRGQAGAYNTTILREAERLAAQLIEEGKEPQLYVTGRRGVGYYTFRHREIVKSWTGGSDNPEVSTAEEIADTLLEAFRAPVAEGGVSEIHLVYTRFASMVSQEPRVVRMLPLEVVEGVVEAGGDVLPLYEFEPSPEAVLDALLPRYIRSRVFNALLQASASELAARQRAMHTATENAEDLIRKYTRLANTARQAEITQEISEIVSGADAMAAS
ncbi:ATP synthase F1, gamma subunit [Beutenbergia cavernae DSM 12333]|uniref:ATP synthase gamma chain n=1 Tax=Beutenbergia cavernae (strain ATCC BAA-8 / DSM 12333 / CCUG 43141 / JCM 11478 / NBRC 16432 / NCIMB 13614 / HKI 0122) TaxID=471853 RepID=ATPG_BEUC1|nr:F0F1 ATP synthase subunit gamma [Beutenbergia cavernae]C5C1U7.1 RecName: Full=ATP synthase gamma chain; AltName: Full=ATP synthase F1 sector gamma subunit; AltName: Full=F-ATPase gamma subunit [Beutenbergia cavernae DSM 12333]ACQ79565.1 ATP synthase F1, gamma subunit [Beutenbergia cavernae DSM 12333]